MNAKRSIRWLSSQPLSADHPYGAVRIACGRRADSYYVREFPADGGGRGFDLEKVEPGVPTDARFHYQVYLGANGSDRQCCCLGFSRHGHCKHVEGLAALLSR